jgi:predicted metal-dependent hydrolase
MQTSSSTVANVKASFPVRRMDYQFGAMPRYWFGHEPSMTHYFTGLSTLFPEGESYFVRSVRALRPALKNNAQLDKDVGAFIGQEAMHSKEHHAFHVSARQFGLDPDSLEKLTGTILTNIEKRFSKKWNLLVTVGMEHYTAVLVESMMTHVHKHMTDDGIRNLWLWHSIEETEHKAVAFDLYEAVYGKGLSAYVPRVAVYTFSIALITLMTYVYTGVLMKRDKQLLNFKSWGRLVKFAAKEYPIFLPKFLQYYRFDFHPNQHNEEEVVKATKLLIGLAEVDAPQYS